MVAAAIRLDNRESEKIRDRKTMAGYGAAVQSSQSSQSRPRAAAGSGGTQQLTTAPSSQPRSAPQAAPTVITGPPATSNDGTTPMELDYVERERTQRITQAERDRQRTNKLCMYCGDSSHFRHECPAIPRRAVNLISQTPHSVNFITEIIEPSDTSATNAYAQE
jgi:hypothetical protein